MLNTVVEAMDHAEKTSTIPPAKTPFFFARDLLVTIRVGSPPVYVGQSLANVYRIQ